MSERPARHTPRRLRMVLAAFAVFAVLTPLYILPEPAEAEARAFYYCNYLAERHCGTPPAGVVGYLRGTPTDNPRITVSVGSQAHAITTGYNVYLNGYYLTTKRTFNSTVEVSLPHDARFKGTIYVVAFSEHSDGTIYWAPKSQAVNYEWVTGVGDPRLGGDWGYGFICATPASLTCPAGVS